MPAPPPPPDQPTQPIPPGGWGRHLDLNHQRHQRRRGRSPGRQVLAVAVVVGVIAFGIGAAVGNGGGTSSGTPNAAGSASQPASSTTEVEVTTTAATIDDTPEPSDFELTVKTLSKQCFGSAGCSITYRIQAGWDGSYDPDRTYEVVYEVRGDESLPNQPDEAHPVAPACEL
jgi:hypothetical protein